MLTNLAVLSSRISAPVPVPAPGVDTANEDPIQIRHIDGLGPVKANINTTQFGSFDGELFNGAAVGKRNIVLTLGLNPNWQTETPQSLRDLLYAYFMPKLWVRLVFSSDTLPDVQIDGYVESFEPNIFSQDPEVQISIICPKPNFVAVDPVIVTGDVETNLNSPVTIDYEGTVETGFIFTVESAASFKGDLTVRNYNVAEELFTTPIAEASPTKYVKMSSIQGEKYIRIMTNQSIVSNLLSSITGQMVWPKLVPGSNVFAVSASPDATYFLPDLPWTLTYYPQYGGL